MPAGEAIYRNGATYACPECGLYSTTADMARWHQLFLDGGVYQGKRTLCKATVAEMLRNQTTGLGEKILQRFGGCNQIQKAFRDTVMSTEILFKK